MRTSGPPETRAELEHHREGGTPDTRKRRVTRGTTQAVEAEEDVEQRTQQTAASPDPEMRETDRAPVARPS